MLKNFGYRNIYEAYDGNDEVEQMRNRAQGSGDEAIDIILMDLWMPRLDGFQATESILQMDELKEKPIVLAVSADVTDAAVDRAGQVGMKGFLTKPFVMRDVERMIVQHCAPVSGPV